MTLPWNADLKIRADQSPQESAIVTSGLPVIRHALVIEDSPLSAQQLARYLTEMGTHVTFHNRGQGQEQHAVTLRPDVILLDILLPDQSGWEILRQLKANPLTQAIPVVIVSAINDPDPRANWGSRTAGQAYRPLLVNHYAQASHANQRQPDSKISHAHHPLQRSPTHSSG